MADWDDDLRRWREAGIVDEDTAARIRAFEARRDVARADRPTVAEALLYVGLIAIGVGAFVLGALLWEDLSTAARVIATAGPGLVAVLLGAMMLPMASPPMRRGGSVAWFIAVPLLAGSVAILLDANDVDGERAFLVTALVAVVLAAVAWAISPTHAQILALGAGLGVFAASIAVEAEVGDYANERGQAIWAGLVVATALVWLAATEIGWLKPKVTARLLGAVGLAGAAYIGGFDEKYQIVFEVAVIAAGVLLVAAAVSRAAFVYMGPGVLALFLGAITIIMRRVPDPVVGALVVILGGIALVVTVLILSRLKPWQRADGAAT